MESRVGIERGGDGGQDGANRGAGLGPGRAGPIDRIMDRESTRGGDCVGLNLTTGRSAGGQAEDSSAAACLLLSIDRLLPSPTIHNVMSVRHVSVVRNSDQYTELDLRARAAGFPLQD